MVDQTSFLYNSFLSGQELLLRPKGERIYLLRCLLYILNPYVIKNFIIFISLLIRINYKFYYKSLAWSVLLPFAFALSEASLSKKRTFLFRASGTSEDTLSSETASFIFDF